VLRLLELMQLKDLENRYQISFQAASVSASPLARATRNRSKGAAAGRALRCARCKVRQELRRWLRELHQELHITTVFVTHDQDEALEVADRVVVMNQARIEQVGTPQEIYDRPATAFVHQFLGKSNALSVNVAEGRATVGNLDVLAPLGTEQPLTAYVRPHNVDLSRHRNGTPAIPVRVQHVNAAGPIARLELIRTDNGEELSVELPREEHAALGLVAGEEAFAKLRKVQVFPRG
jgi:sulfate transport system ATP-binding protein